MSDILKNVWKIELEIMDIFHSICKKYELKYSLAYGTLLGAVRHKGFIPWDDDIDVIMPRKDYDFLIKIWDVEAPNNYLLQAYENNIDYTNNFVKIRKNHTTFLQSENEAEKKYHKGIFIDIFPVDNVAPSCIGRAIQYSACAINLLYTKRFRSGTRGITGVVEWTLLTLGNGHYKELYSISKKIMTSWNNKITDKCFCSCRIGLCKKYLPNNIFNNLVLLEFNGKQYFATAFYDQFLKTFYGDYMKLPPESERVWKHHPILIDFDKNYEELEEVYEK